jgi:DNA ligase-1
MPLDGELWAGRGQFQVCRLVCAKFVPINEEWEKIDFAIYGSPPFAAIFMDGRINCPQFRREISLDVVSRWLDKLPDSLLQDFKFLPKGTCFEHELLILQESVPLEGQIYLLKQRKLPFLGAAEIVERDLESVIDNGGEGLVLRDPQSCWEPQRSHQLLKYKPFSDAEGVITGFTSGQETERGSKHLGKIGALIVDYGGVRLKLSGLTGEEREFADNKMAKYAKENPGKDMPANTVGKHFKVGQVVTFKYRELSKDQVPKDARYFRPFQPE